MKMSALICCGLMAAASCARADGDENHELNQFFEANAVSAAYARMCDEEPIAEQLKANTMMLLVVHGMPAHNVQLGSAKWSEIIRHQFNSTRRTQDIDCTARVAEAKGRLAQTQSIIQATRH